MEFNEDNLRKGLNELTQPGTQRYEKAVVFYKKRLAADKDLSAKEAIEATLQYAVNYSKPLVNPGHKLELARRAAGVTLHERARSNDSKTVPIPRPAKPARVKRVETKATSSTFNGYTPEKRWNSTFNKRVLPIIGTIIIATAAGGIMWWITTIVLNFQFGDASGPLAFLAKGLTALAIFVLVISVVIWFATSESKSQEHDDEHEPQHDTDFNEGDPFAVFVEKDQPKEAVR